MCVCVCVSHSTQVHRSVGYFFFLFAFFVYDVLSIRGPCSKDETLLHTLLLCVSVCVCARERDLYYLWIPKE